MKTLNWIFGEYKWCNYLKHFSLVDTFGRTKGRYGDYCKPCTSVRAKLYRASHHEECSIRDKKNYQKNKEKVHVRNVSYKKRNPQRVWAGGVKHSHKRHNVQVNVDINFIHKMALSTPNCNICGIELNYGRYTKNGHVGKDSPTVDRINNAPSLDADNIWILCHECNSTKRTKTLPEFIDYCQYVVDHKEEILQKSKIMVGGGDKM